MFYLVIGTRNGSIDARDGLVRYIVLSEHRTLAEAKTRRWASGDLIADQVDQHAMRSPLPCWAGCEKNAAESNLRICQDSSWLWDWETREPRCFAQTAIRLNTIPF